MAQSSLRQIQKEITGCVACPRLRRYCLNIAKEKRRAYADQEYWGKPIGGFGDSRARVLIVGLAPAAHGANRTGRIFTGDRSGDWLYRALYKSGFANQPQSHSVNDGLELRDAFITCITRCAPPDNQPTPDEIRKCSAFLRKEIQLLPNIQAIIVLGHIALKGLWSVLDLSLSRPKFGHGQVFKIPNGPVVVMSYHPSQQNTFTGRLTESMFDQVFASVRSVLT